MITPPEEFIPRRKRKSAIYARFTELKDRKKIARVIFQLIVLSLFLVSAVNAFYAFTAYKPYTEETTAVSGKGFVALSYFGVTRVGKQNIIGAERLQEHLQALKDQGYVTVNQQDIIDYYQQRKDLPEKSLFLIFEDGRRDTAVFAQKILESLNYKATLLTYPEKFDGHDLKFLTLDELKALEKTTFWEMGTNGYRLYFINVFDRYDNYLGEMDALNFNGISPYIGRKYNHYLMDYIRDEYGIPKESHTRMKERISHDYEMLRDIYTQSFGYVPGTYILMHSNTGKFGNNDKVSAINEYWIKTLFKMNFNREGFALNQRNSSIYDLTRMQPQPYWYTNHLLMRIKYDINQDLEFVKGNLNKHKMWETLKGALEIKDESMVLTALPQDKGLIRLKNSSDYEDIKLSVRLKGNKLGLQRIYLRSDETVNRFLSVYILNNVLYVSEKNNGAEQQLFKLSLDQHDGKEILSVPEDKKAAEVSELKVFMQHTDLQETAKGYEARLDKKVQEEVQSVAEGAEQYVPAISVHEKGDRKLVLSLKGDKLSITVDDKEAVKELQVLNSKAGSIFLESSWGGFGQNQRNLADDVYDGVFEKLKITENAGVEKERILFDSSLEGFDAVKLKLKKAWETILDFFVE
jgi:hypothetical protein